MKVRNPDFERRVRESFASQSMMATLGASITDVEPGTVSFFMTHHEGVTQQHGFVHGGAVAAILDSACGYAALTVMDRDAEVLTVEFKTNFIAPALGKTYRFDGLVIKPGRTLIFTEGKAFASDGGSEKLVAVMTATMMVVTNRDDVKSGSPSSGIRI